MGCCTHSGGLYLDAIPFSALQGLYIVQSGPPARSLLLSATKLTVAMTSLWSLDVSAGLHYLGNSACALATLRISDNIQLEPCAGSAPLLRCFPRQSVLHRATKQVWNPAVLTPPVFGREAGWIPAVSCAPTLHHPMPVVLSFRDIGRFRPPSAREPT
jgi:hypothetical protein